MDWASLFVPTLPLGEIFVRGTIVYLFLFFLLRFLRREAGELGISDLLVIVLIADAAQNAMASDYTSISEGLILVSTIAFWNYFLDWLSFKSAFARRLLRPQPLLLIKDGRMIPRNMKREMINEEDLLGQLREHGVDRVVDVRRCYLESEGRVSVVKRD